MCSLARLRRRDDNSSLLPDKKRARLDKAFSVHMLEYRVYTRTRVHFYLIMSGAVKLYPALALMRQYSNVVIHCTSTKYSTYMIHMHTNWVFTSFCRQNSERYGSTMLGWNWTRDDCSQNGDCPAFWTAVLGGQQRTPFWRLHSLIVLLYHCCRAGCTWDHQLAVCPGTRRGRRDSLTGAGPLLYWRPHSSSASYFNSLGK